MLRVASSRGGRSAISDAIGRVCRAVRFPRFNNDFTMISRAFSDPSSPTGARGREGGTRVRFQSRCDLSDRVLPDSRTPSSSSSSAQPSSRLCATTINESCSVCSPSILASERDVLAARHFLESRREQQRQASPVGLLGQSVSQSVSELVVSRPYVRFLRVPNERLPSKAASFTTSFCTPSCPFFRVSFRAQYGVLGAISIRDSPLRQIDERGTSTDRSIGGRSRSPFLAGAGSENERRLNETKR